MTCPYCLSWAELTDDSAIYGRSYGGMVYKCTHGCDAYVFADPKTLKPYGRLADAELRALKKEAHSWFDPLWKANAQLKNIPGWQAKKIAYDWLAEQLGEPKEDMDIGWLDVSGCRLAIDICKAAYNGKPRLLQFKIQCDNEKANR